MTASPVTPPTSPLDLVPIDIKRQILECLDIKDYGTVARLDKLWHAVMEKPGIWEKAASKLHILPPIDKATLINPAAYAERCQIARELVIDHYLLHDANECILQYFTPEEAKALKAATTNERLLYQGILVALRNMNIGYENYEYDENEVFSQHPFYQLLLQISCLMGAKTTCEPQKVNTAVKLIRESILPDPVKKTEVIWYIAFRYILQSNWKLLPKDLPYSESPHVPTTAQITVFRELVSQYASKVNKNDDVKSIRDALFDFAPLPETYRTLFQIAMDAGLRPTKHDDYMFTYCQKLCGWDDKPEKLDLDTVRLIIKYCSPEVRNTFSESYVKLFHRPKMFELLQSLCKEIPYAGHPEPAIAGKS